MPKFHLTNVALVGMAAAVPAVRSAVGPTNSVTEAELAKVLANTGVMARHLAPPEICTSDLCAAAAERLIEKLGWERSSIDLLILVTQTPDYVLPATACSLHGRLGLGKGCAAFDVNLGCSGFVYGLSVAAMHLQTGAAKRALLLVGDTISKVVSRDDRSAAFLFGDAGTATALEGREAAPMHFVTVSDGAGAEDLRIAAGMFRLPSSEQTRTVTIRENGNARNDEELFMNGPEIFNFTIREVPGMIGSVMQAAGWGMNDVDRFVLHQANRFMLEYLAKRIKVPPDKLVLALENHGNTSSASIPLAICDQLAERLAQGPAQLVLAGFGVGFSWAAAAITLDRPWIEPILSLPVP